jgi:heme/copper-type cytochrome/quinol oxidase subunit 2
MTMQKKRHSDSLDLISRLNLEKGIFIVSFILVSVLLLVGLDRTGYMIKDQNVHEVNMFVDEWEFIPNVVKVKYNENVRLKLMTSENRSFGFKLSRYMYNDKVIINPGNVTNFDFKAQTKGTFIFRCEEPCGYGRGLMRGRLIVE